MEDWKDVQLPDGYRQRIERDVLEVQTVARRIVGIVEEFDGKQIVLTDGDIEVIIKSTRRR